MVDIRTSSFAAKLAAFSCPQKHWKGLIFRGALKNLIIFWNPHKEWKVLEYAANGKYWISHEFDASVECETQPPGQLSLEL